MSCSAEKDEGPRDGIAKEVPAIGHKEPCLPFSRLPIPNDHAVVLNNVVEATSTGITPTSPSRPPSLSLSPPPSRPRPPSPSLPPSLPPPPPPSPSPSLPPSPSPPPRHSSNRDYSGRRADDTTRLMSKILIPLAVGGMFMVSEMKSFESVSRAGVLIFWVSISLMVLGLNIKFKWLERVGHMLFFIGLMLVCSPIIIGPKHDPRFLWIPPLVAALLFASSLYFE